MEPPIPARIYSSEDRLCVIYIPEDLHVFIDSNEELTDIIIDTSSYIPSAPGLYTYTGKIYRISSFTEEGWGENTVLQQEVQLTVYFSPDKIPEGAEVFLVSYHPVYGWIKLDASGGLAEGQITAWVDYLNLVAIIYEIDVSYVELITPDTTTPPVPDKEPSDDKAIWAQASLGLAVSGTFSMTILAIIERRRRHRREELD